MKTRQARVVKLLNLLTFITEKMLLPNLPPPEEGIRHQSHGIDAYVNQRHLGTGTLFIAESRLSWAKENSTEGLSLEYPHIAVHAVSRDPSSFQYPCLYLMLDINIDVENVANGHNDVEDEDDDDDDDESEMTEIRFVPREPSLLEIMYKSLNDCQVLHPDADNEDDENDYYGYNEDQAEYNVEQEEYYAGNGNELYEESFENGVEDENMENEPFEDENRFSGNEDDVEMGQFDDADNHM